jgi:hypothetical protein
MGGNSCRSPGQLKAVDMVDVPALTAHVAPDTIWQLERAAEKRYEEGECLKRQNRLLAALYLYGYSVEMCLAAAYFRRAGFGPGQTITEDERRRRMRVARHTQHPDGEPLMSNAPHPLVGWARYLQWQRRGSEALTSQDEQRLREAVQKAKQVQKHWRPELRYKTTDVATSQLDEVRRCVCWFVEQRGRL